MTMNNTSTETRKILPTLKKRKTFKITSKEARLYVKVLMLLKSDVFWNWYSSSFQAYVRKDINAPTREKIIEDLYTMVEAQK